MILTVDGMIARSENRAMVELIPIRLVPVETVNIDAQTAVVMVDTQPHTGRRHSEAAMPQVVLDHHETGGVLSGVLFSDIRTHLGATSTMITGYLLEQRVMVTRRWPRPCSTGSSRRPWDIRARPARSTTGRSIWLFPRADKDLLARIRNPKLPQSHFATFHSALANAFLYDKLIFGWCGTVTQPDIIAEIADFFIRFDQVDWSLSAGVFDHQIKLSLRAGQLGGRAGEVLQAVVNGMGNAGRPRQAGRRRGRAARSAGRVHRADPERDPPSIIESARHRRAAGPPPPRRVPGHPGTVSGSPECARTLG